MNFLGGKKISKKILGIFIAIVAIIGIYGLFYIAITTVLMPMDLTAFKEELDTVQVPVNNASSISEMESGAADMESTSTLDYVSESERSEVANTMRIANTPPPGFLDQNLEEYNQFNSYRMLAYNLIFRGDISNQIKNISSSHEEISRLNNDTELINQKMYTDMENGDTKAYAEDLKKIASNLKQYNITMAKLKTQLQNLIGQLEQ
jgi:hypothetical protein